MEEALDELLRLLRHGGHYEHELLNLVGMDTDTRHIIHVNSNIDEAARALQEVIAEAWGCEATNNVASFRKQYRAGKFAYQQLE